MFAEYLINQTWQDIVPGISACYPEEAQHLGQLPLTIQPGHAEILFCTGGCMTVYKNGGAQTSVESRGILLVSDCSRIQNALVTEALEGIFLSVDYVKAGESIRQLCHSFGDLNFSLDRMGEHMVTAGGVRAVPVSPWSRGVFYALKRLPEEEYSSYCVLKAFELIYLICAQEQNDPSCQQEMGGGTLSAANSMKNYMETHLDEKLTITELSHKFHMSRTACKSAFRCCFGQPIHSWLLDRRMERAAELLEKTKMPILQVAQSVGYTGVSQFNVAFRQRYGKSPREYRKMSVSVAF